MKEARAESRVAPREGKSAAARGKKTSAALGGWLDSLRSLPQQTRAFLGDVRAETKRVSWPSSQQIRATTVVVILTVFFFGTYFGILDWIFTAVVGRLLQWGG